MRRNHLSTAGIAVGSLLALTALWLLVISPAIDTAIAATGYAAKTVCSCLYVEVRDLRACKHELDAGAGGLAVHNDSQAKLVRVHLMLIFAASAVYEPPDGCRLN